MEKTCACDIESSHSNSYNVSLQHIIYNVFWCTDYVARSHSLDVNSMMLFMLDLSWHVVCRMQLSVLGGEFNVCKHLHVFHLVA